MSIRHTLLASGLSAILITLLYYVLGIRSSAQVHYKRPQAFNEGDRMKNVTILKDAISLTKEWFRSLKRRSARAFSLLLKRVGDSWRGGGERRLNYERYNVVR